MQSTLCLHWEVVVAVLLVMIMIKLVVSLLVVEGGVLAVLPEEEAEASLAASTGSTGAA